MAGVASKRPDNSAFKQQTLKAWRPILTPQLVILLFSVVGIIFVPIGGIILSVSNQVEEFTSVDYSAAEADGGCCKDNCSASDPPWTRVESNPCNITIDITSDMKPPIYVYYKLTKYYQNHRRYVRSRDDNQLKGDTVTQAELEEEDSCTYHVLEGPSGDPNSIVSPCGLIAWSVFNDTFTLSKPGGEPVIMNETSIAWDTDLEYKFKNSPNGSTGRHFPQFAHWRSRACSELPSAAEQVKCNDANVPQAGWCFPGSGYCVEDQHFVVWMRAAGLPDFRKLYSIIHEPLSAGKYTINIANGDPSSSFPGRGGFSEFLYPVVSFGGTKSIVLSETSAIGGKNLFLGYAYVVVGVICIVLAVCFLIKYRMSPRDIGDANYITWQKGPHRD